MYGYTERKKVFSNSHGGTEAKRNKKRLVIRKNFKDIKKIRELLNTAIDSRQQ